MHIKCFFLGHKTSGLFFHRHGFRYYRKCLRCGKRKGKRLNERDEVYDNMLDYWKCQNSGAETWW